MLVVRDAMYQENIPAVVIDEKLIASRNGTRPLDFAPPSFVRVHKAVFVV